MTSSLITKILNATSVDGPLKEEDQDHFEGTAFRLGQQDYLLSKAVSIKTGSPIELTIPYFLSVKEVNQWHIAIKQEMVDCADMVRALNGTYTRPKLT